MRGVTCGRIRLHIPTAKASGCHQQVCRKEKPRDSCDGDAGRVPLTIGNRPEVNCSGSGNVSSTPAVNDRATRKDTPPVVSGNRRVLRPLRALKRPPFTSWSCEQRLENQSDRIPRRIAGSYDMKNPPAIFDEIAALQQQGLDPEQIAARLEALAMEDAQTRAIGMVRGPRGTVRLRFLLEGAEIYFDGPNWHLQHP